MFWVQLFTLFRKDLILKKRNWQSSATECFCPLFCVIVATFAILFPGIGVDKYPLQTYEGTSYILGPQAKFSSPVAPFPSSCADIDVFAVYGIQRGAWTTEHATLCEWQENRLAPPEYHCLMILYSLVNAAFFTFMQNIEKNPHYEAKRASFAVAPKQYAATFGSWMHERAEESLLGPKRMYEETTVLWAQTPYGVEGCAERPFTHKECAEAVWHVWCKHGKENHVVDCDDGGSGGNLVGLDDASFLERRLNARINVSSFLEMDFPKKVQSALNENPYITFDAFEDSVHSKSIYEEMLDSYKKGHADRPHFEKAQTVERVPPSSLLQKSNNHGDITLETELTNTPRYFRANTKRHRYGAAPHDVQLETQQDEKPLLTTNLEDSIDRPRVIEDDGFHLVSPALAQTAEKLTQINYFLPGNVQPHDQPLHAMVEKLNASLNEPIIEPVVVNTDKGTAANCRDAATAMDCADLWEHGCGWAKFPIGGGKCMGPVNGFNKRFYTDCCEAPDQVVCNPAEKWQTLGRVFDAIIPNVVGMKDSDDIDDLMRDKHYPQPYTSTDGRKLTGRVCGAVVFDQDPEHSDNVGYSLRLNQTTSSGLDLPFWTAIDTSVGGDLRVFMAYYVHGFLDLQKTLTDYVMETRLGKRFTETVRFVPFARPRHQENGLLTAASKNLPIIFAVSASVVAGVVGSKALHEKRDRIRQGMRMMGMQEMPFFLSHILFLSIWYLVPTAIAAMTFLSINGSAGYVLEFSSFSCIWGLFYFAHLSVSIMVLALTSFFQEGGAFATVVIMCGTFITSLINLIITDNWGWKERIYISFIPMSAFYQSVATLMELEKAMLGATMSTLFVPVKNYSFADGMGMMFLDCFIWFLLWIYLEKVFPSDGVPEKPWFPLSFYFWRSALGWKTKKTLSERDTMLAQDRMLGHTFEQPDQYSLQMQENSEVMQVNHLCKEFKVNGRRFNAVNNVNLTLYNNEIFALLGHNGAGKTTTINCLTGLIQPTAGSATVFGVPLETQLKENRSEIGVCPQHDVLWSELTVEEHLHLYASFKGLTFEDCEVHIQGLLMELGLLAKRHAAVSQLSGGMKRKLSLAIAFMGDPKVVFLDEPTSGMDPTSRRDTWNILRRRKQGRVIILTTHYMDEADVLGDKIAIMAKGQVQCCGSPQFLKKVYGCGYNLMIRLQDGVCGGALHIIDVIRQVIPQDKKLEMLSNVGTELIFLIDFESAQYFPELFRLLEERRATLRIEDWGVSVANLEEVFLKVLCFDRPEDESSGIKEYRTTNKALETLPTTSNSSVNELDRQLSSSSTQAPVVRARNLNSEKPVTAFFTHFRAVFMKRFIVSIRDPMSLLCQLVAPIILLFVLMSVIQVLCLDEPYTKLSMAPYNTYIPTYEERVVVPWGRTGFAKNAKHFMQEHGHDDYWDRAPVLLQKFRNESQCPEDEEDCRSATFGEEIAQRNVFAGTTEADQAKISGILSTNCFMMEDSGGPGYTTNMSQSLWTAIASSSNAEEADNDPLRAYCLNLHRSRNSLKASRYGGYFFQNIEEPIPHLMDVNEKHKEKDDSVINVLFNMSGVHSSAIFAEQLYNMMLKSANTNVTIEGANHPFPFTYFKRSQLVTAQSISLGMFVSLAMGLIPTVAIATLVRDRETETKAMMTMTGMSLPAYWLANFIFDVLIYILPCIGIFWVMHYHSLHGLTNEYAYDVTVALFAAFALAASAFAFAVSTFFDSVAKALVVAMGSSVGLGFIFVLTTNLMQYLEGTRPVIDMLVWVFRLLPTFCLGNAFIQMSILYQTTFSDHVPGEYGEEALQHCHDTYPAVPRFQCSGTYWDINGPGAELFMLIFDFFFYFLIFTIHDMIQEDPRWQKMFAFSAPRKSVPEGLQDDDVFREKRRVDEINPKDYSIYVRDLRKVYMRPKLNKHNFCPSASSCSSDTSSYTELHAVQGISFAVPPGAVVGLLGINGAGKTSTFKMFASRLPPTEGDIHLAGIDAVAHPVESRAQIGYCPQADALVDQMTTREMMRFYGRIRGVEEEDLERIIDEQLNALGLTPHEHQWTCVLSGGNKRKLMVAIALIGEPPILLLDEPSAGMDPMARRFMWDVLKNVARRHRRTTVVLSTHSMEECEALCNRTIIMVNGVIRCYGSNEHIKNKYSTGYQLHVKVKKPSEARMQELLSAWKVDSEQVVTLRAVTAYLMEIRNKRRELADYVLVQLRESSTSPFGLMTHDQNSMAKSSIVADWVLQQETRFEWHLFLIKEVEQYMLVEQHGLVSKYRLPRARTLADMFQMMQDNFEYLCIDEYSLCQTTLEQVFNAFARQQVQNEIDDSQPVQLTSQSCSKENPKKMDDEFHPIAQCSTQDSWNEGGRAMSAGRAQQPEPEEETSVLNHQQRASSSSMDRDPIFSAAADRQKAADLVEGLLRSATGPLPNMSPRSDFSNV